MTVSGPPLVVRQHHCISQEMVAQRLEEPPAKKCSCRKYIPYRKANEMVKNGEARWAVASRERGLRSEVCSLCGGDKEVKNCANCAGKGFTTVSVVWDSYNYDIVLVSQSAHDPKEKKYRPALALKTPRVATIESKHIIRAYADGNPDAADRIEEYGRLVTKEQLRLLAKNVSREEFDIAWANYEEALLEQNYEEPPILLVPISMEPEDDAEKGQGRRFDYGRTV